MRGRSDQKHHEEGNAKWQVLIVKSGDTEKPRQAKSCK